MHTIAQRSTPVQHDATYHDVHGVATLMAGGYAFQPDDSRDSWLVSYTDADLILFGRCDLVEDADPRPLWQRVADPATYEGTYRRDLVRGR